MTWPGGSLAAYADSVHWAHAALDDWITTAALGFIGAGVILHIAIGLRWPIVASAEESSQSSI